MRHRKGFILTNGSGCYIAGKEEKNEIDELLATGWRIATIRPICTSTAVKLYYLPASVLEQKIFSYSLCVLEKKVGGNGDPPPGDLPAKDRRLPKEAAAAG